MKFTTFITALTLLIIPTIGFAQDSLPLQLFGLSSSQGRVIRIDGVVDQQSALRAISDLKRLDAENQQEIEIDIMSPGGSVYAGLAIIDQMFASKSHIKTVCEGYCMSMGAFILASGSKGRRYAMPHSTILLHQVASQGQGNLAEMENELGEMKRLQAIINNLLETDTGLNEETVNKLCDHDNYMSPTTAKSFNIIDGIMNQ